MKRQELYLLLGTNLGNRAANIEDALRRLEAVFGTPLRQSQVIETEACGFSAPPFLNTVAVYLSARKPETILKICKKIERSMGRTDAPEYAPDGSRIYHNRIIDIDILTYGEITVDTPELKIPHPQIKTRPFVQILLRQIKNF